LIKKLLKLACGAGLAVALAFGVGSAQAAEELNDFVYQLRRINLASIRQTKFDLVITDYSRDDSHEKKFTPEKIAGLKASPGGFKTVLSYMSIDEAEDYRWYWQRSWGPEQERQAPRRRPNVAGTLESELAGQLQGPLLGPGLLPRDNPRDLDKALAAGYDGVYLDIVDTYQS
jgi:cysteinyl-tRNA synthetase